MTRGGKREGAGRKIGWRKPEDEKSMRSNMFSARVTSEEYDKLKEYLQNLRQGENH